MAWRRPTHLPCPVALVLFILQSRESTFSPLDQLWDYSGKVEKGPTAVACPKAMIGLSTSLLPLFLWDSGKQWQRGDKMSGHGSIGKGMRNKGKIRGEKERGKDAITENCWNWKKTLLFFKEDFLSQGPSTLRSDQAHMWPLCGYLNWFSSSKSPSGYLPHIRFSAIWS